MAIMDGVGDSDMTRLWQLLMQMSEQLAQNRQASIQLHSLAGGVKAQAVHSQTGFVLRRYNLDKSQEEYNTELERMNAQMSAENNTLLNENKQLSALIKEYEQTLENIMTTFRTRANEVQQRELSIVREYESKILLRETEELARTLSQSTDFSSHLGRIGELLRSVMRALGGEDPDSIPFSASLDPSQPGEPSTSLISLPRRERQVINSLEVETEDQDANAVAENEAQIAASEWALERECELARLEQENAFLRHLVTEHLSGKDPLPPGTELPRLPRLPRLPPRTSKGRLGGRDVGPFGIYKKQEE